MTSRLLHTRRKVEHFKEYYSTAGGKTPYYPLHEAVKDTKHRRFGWGDSLQIWPGNSRIACKCLTSVLRGRGRLNRTRTDGAEGCLAARQQYQWLASQMILSVEEAEKSATTSQGHHTVDHLENEGHKKRQWPTIYIQSIEPTGLQLIIHETLLPVQH